MLVACVGALGAALAFGHAVPVLALVTLIVGAFAVSLATLVIWFRLTVLGSRWMLFSDRLVVQRPGAPGLDFPLADLGGVRLESISGFGMQEPILKFVDDRDRLIFWTLASR